MTLLEKLDAWSKLKTGDRLPPELDTPNNWGAAVSKILAEAAQELRRYQVWVNDLQADMYVNCVYCGHRYGPGETTPVSMQDALKAHIAVCPQHPMSALLASLKEFQQHIVYDDEGDLTRAEFSAMCARADVALAKVQP